MIGYTFRMIQFWIRGWSMLKIKGPRTDPCGTSRCISWGTSVWTNPFSWKRQSRVKISSYRITTARIKVGVAQGSSYVLCPLALNETALQSKPKLPIAKCMQSLKLLRYKSLLIVVWKMLVSNPSEFSLVPAKAINCFYIQYAVEVAFVQRQIFTTI